MDVGEALFAWALKWWKRTPFTASVDAEPGIQKLADHVERFELLAAMLFGGPAEIVPDSGSGGSAGRTILLPSRVTLSDDAEQNLAIYRYRTAWAWASHTAGFDGAVGGTDPLLDALCTTLAAAQTRRLLHEALPSTQELSATLQPLALAARPARALKDASFSLELLIRLLLGAEASILDGYRDDVRAWINDAIAVRPTDAASLRREARRLLPGLIATSGRGDAPPPVLLWGRLLPLPQAADIDDELERVIDEDDRDRERRVIELDRTIRLERQKMAPREDRPLFHIFEKLETAEEFNGETATPDMSGDAGQMEDAISDLKLGAVVRTTEDPRNLVRADLVMEPTMLEVGGGMSTKPRAFPYPEWDYKRNEYRDDWCTVHEERYIAGEASEQNLERARELLRAEHRHVEEIRADLIRTLTRRRVRNRQPDGPEIDLEAMVERHADLVAGHTPPDRLYLSARQTLREVAVLVLIDSSWSTDAWIEDRRVLDVELSSLLVVAEAFKGYLDEEVAVASFQSHTRNDVRYGILKGFDDSWRTLRQIAPSLRPDGYTRIGAAIRHSTTLLEASKARRKLLLILSDGKPTDYDRYEGEYGIEDVRQSIREARQRQIHTFGIAIEKEAKLYLARMLGPGSHRILPRPSMLPAVMGELFVDLLAG